jgi:ribosome-interacting GTPase 1
VARTADVILMMLDATKGAIQKCVAEPYVACVEAAKPPASCGHPLPRSTIRELLTKELEACDIRLNQERPNIYFKVRSAVVAGHN